MRPTNILWKDLRHLDSLHRQEVQQLTNKKVISLDLTVVLFLTNTAQNLYTHQCITALRHISSLNNEIIHLPPLLATLQASFRAKTSFPHIQRLHNMLYAYGATIVEVVRRKEFCGFLKIPFAGRSGFDMLFNSKVLLSTLTKYTRDYGETFVCI